MIRFILTLSFLMPLSLARAETSGANLVIVLPDAFSEADTKKQTLDVDIAENLTSPERASWENIRNQDVADFNAVSAPRGSKLNDLFSIHTSDGTAIIQLKSPQIETILERKILARRYLARLNLLASKWHPSYSKVVIAGIGRGADVGEALLSTPLSITDTAASWLKNTSGVIAIGDSKKILQALGIAQEGGPFFSESAQITRQKLIAALQQLDSNIRTLNSGLSHLNQTQQTSEKLDHKKISKIYTYYLLSIIGFLEDISKLPGHQAAQTALKMTNLAADIFADPEVKGKLISFVQLWMTKPDKDMALFLMQEMINPEVAQKVSDLNNIFSEGKTYKEMPVIARIYIQALKQALSASSEDLVKNINSSAQAPTNSSVTKGSLFVGIFTQHTRILGASISQIKSGLLDMSQNLPDKQNRRLHIKFSDPTAPKLDKELLNKILEGSEKLNSVQQAGRP